MTRDMERHPRSYSLWLGVVLSLVGLAGVFVLGVAGSYPGRVLPGVEPRAGGCASVGERLFFTGRDEQGSLVPFRGGPMGMGMHFTACADCHGSDGRGRVVTGMMQRFQTPDIRWSALSSGATGGGHEHEPYTLETFARAVREGIAPDGDRLEPEMPRWGLTDAQVRALVDFLKTL